MSVPRGKEAAPDEQEYHHYPPSEGRPDVLRVAAYCRVSTDMEEQASSYASQIRSYTELISQHEGWELVDIYADKGITGTSMKKRVEFKKMITACKRGKIDLILTKSLSRFARNTVDSLEVVRMLRANGIGVIFEKENINTLTESSEFLLTLFSGFAQAESESISKNVIWGIQKSREAGNVPFQYQKMLGYRRGPDSQPEIVPAEAEVVKRIYRRYLDGCSLAQIKRELEADGVPAASGIRGWTYQVVRNILTNERYIGDALLQKTYTTDCISKTVKKNQGDRPMVYVEGNHPAIVSKAMFYQVREEMARRSSKRKVMQKTGRTEQGKYSAKYALSELLVCGECGTPYKRCAWARNGKKRIVWRCVSRLEFGTKYCHNSPSMDEDKLHQAILEGINEFVQAGQGFGDELLDLASIVQQGGSADGIDPLTLRNRLDALTAQQAELLDKVLEDMENEELNAQLKAIMEEKQAILGRLGAIQQDEEQRAGQEARLRELAEWLKQQKSEFTEYDDTITRKYVERITVVDAETIRIKFRYTDVEIDRAIRK